MKKNTKKRQADSDQPVTLAQLKQVLKPLFGEAKRNNKRFEQIDERFEQIDERFEQIDKRFNEIDRRFDIIETRLEMHDRRFIALNVRIEALEKKVSELTEEFRNFIIKMYNLVDASLKRTEENEREILFLGKQHDDLAKYCTEKIAYPAYGKNL